VRFVCEAIAPPLSAKESNHGIIVGGVTEGVGVLEGVGVWLGVGDFDGVRVLRGVRVRVALGVGVKVFVEVAVGGNRRVGVSNTSAGYSSNMAE
jgi:hypothetical protein